MAAPVAAEIFRTPDERFEGLPDFDFEPHYVDVGGMRVAYLDEGSGQPLVMLHGEPSWSFLFRHVIPPLRDAGYRCIAIDYVGFGRSDKPVDVEWYSYDRHTEVVTAVLDEVGIRDAVLVGHDWGGPIGVRAGVERPDLFARFALIDTPFFTGRQTMPPLWWEWRNRLEETRDIEIAELVHGACSGEPTPEVVAAYEAPFPTRESRAGALAFPLRVLPLDGKLPAARAGWKVLKAMRKDDRPALMLWGEDDVMFPLMLGQWVAGALSRPLPIPIAGAGHFALEDKPGEVTQHLLDWLGG